MEIQCTAMLSSSNDYRWRTPVIYVCTYNSGFGNKTPTFVWEECNDKTTSTCNVHSVCLHRIIHSIVGTVHGCVRVDRVVPQSRRHEELMYDT